MLGLGSLCGMPDGVAAPVVALRIDEAVGVEVVAVVARNEAVLATLLRLGSFDGVTPLTLRVTLGGVAR